MAKNQKKKTKQKILLTIPWTKKYKTSVTKSFLKKSNLIFLALIIVLLIGLISNVLPFAYNTVRCGRLPVESTKFAAAYSYKLPGDKAYGVNIFSDYHFCTEAEIKATNGYHRNVFTDAAKKENEELRAQRKDAQVFSLSRVNYTVYKPVGYTIQNQRMSEIKGNIHTFYTVKRETGLPISVRQLQKDDAYNICNLKNDPNDRYCKIIGTDSQGREVKREYTNGIKGWKSYYVGTNIGDTGIILGSDNNQEAIAILGSMKEYSE